MIIGSCFSWGGAGVRPREVLPPFEGSVQQPTLPVQPPQVARYRLFADRETNQGRRHQPRQHRLVE